MRVSACSEPQPALAPPRPPQISRVVARGWLLGAALSAVTSAAAAQSAPPISVEREPGAEDCPDTAGLVARVEAIVGRAGSQDSTPYRVTFSRGPQAFTAAIRSGTGDATVRFLDAREPNCAALAHATAIALAVLFDADLGGAGGLTGNASTRPEAKSAQPGAAKAAPAPAPTHQAPPSASDALERQQPSSPGARVDPLLSLGGAAVVGVLRPIGLAFVLDLGLEIKDFRATLGALWVPPETLALAPGSAREHLLSGTLRACYALLRPQSARFDLCSGVLVGGESAEARGFSENDPEHTQLFLAFPVELAISARSRFLGWELSASGLVLYRPNEFNVDGVGLTYRPPPVAGMLALRVFVEPLR